MLALKQEDKNKEGSDEEWSDDDKYDPKEAPKKERKLLGKRKKGGLEGDMDELKDFFKNDGIEEVPQNDLSKKKKKSDDDLPDGYSSMDSDDIAETRALAKKMLRKKFREETIGNSYSRYAFEDDEDILPTWFLEDEARHSVPNYNLTKEEIDEEKQALREWNARPSKKVTEAKNRKKMRLVKAMNKIKTKANVIANQDMAEGSKMRQI